ncbi:MAG: hypothetical protein PT953_08610, partial [Prevotella sp.]|nr:hypothetical protein [Prevotella sp.]
NTCRANCANCANFRIVFLVFVRRLTILFLRHDSAKSKQASSLLSLLPRLTIRHKRCYTLFFL